MQTARSATLLCGRSLSASLEVQWHGRAAAVGRARGRPVGLGVLLVGDNPASELYVRHKQRAAARVGLESQVIRLPGTASIDDVEAAIERLNDDPHIDAFLLQLPLPAGLQAQAARLVGRIAPHKDADGLHPDNVGKALSGTPGPRPCTPLGCMRLLESAGVSLPGARAVVLGRSAIVGQPMALMLSQADATVTLCHAKSHRIDEDVRRADIVVAATGVRHLVKGHWLKPGACVIDVGISRFVDENGRTRIAGDVDFEAALNIAGAITPVPGGVGPMTISMLLGNAILAAERS